MDADEDESTEANEENKERELNHEIREIHEKKKAEEWPRKGARRHEKEKTERRGREFRIPFFTC